MVVHSKREKEKNRSDTKDRLWLLHTNFAHVHCCACVLDICCRCLQLSKDKLCCIAVSGSAVGDCYRLRCQAGSAA